MQAPSIVPNVPPLLLRFIRTNHDRHGTQVLWLSDGLALIRVDFRHTPARYEACCDNAGHEMYEENGAWSDQSLGSALGENAFCDLARRKCIDLWSPHWQIVGQWHSPR